MSDRIEQDVKEVRMVCGWKFGSNSVECIAYD